jgi:hypothetical protein
MHLVVMVFAPALSHRCHSSIPGVRTFLKNLNEINLKKNRIILIIWITGPQSTNPKYLKNAKSEHLIG